MTPSMKAIRDRGYNAGSKDGHAILRVYDRKKAKAKIEEFVAEHGKKRLYFIDDAAEGAPISNWWDDISPVKYGTGYPTEKPLQLLDRIIRGSSNKDDIMFDPFCGCATSMVAAEIAGRQWVGVDVSPKAVELVKKRLAEMHGTKAQPAFDMVNVNPLVTPPIRTDLGDLPNYRTHKNRLYGEQEGNCAACGHHFPITGLVIDHKVPKSRSGTDHPDNLQLLCAGCNSRKGKMTMPEFMASLKR